MEHISYLDQIFWGTSLNMAKESEIELCYKYIKEQIEHSKIFYSKCKQAELTKKHWMCGEHIKNFPLCKKQHSVLKDHLIEVINKMVTTDVNIDEENIVDSLESKGYIQIYPCSRVYFMK